MGMRLTLTVWPWIICYFSVLTLANEPPQPPTFNKEGKGPVDRSIFKHYEEGHGIPFNKFIPKLTLENIRIATWNVHMLQDLLDPDVSAVDRFVGDLGRIQADVLVLQEIPKEGKALSGFMEGLKSIGFEYREVRYSRSESCQLGIMIASRYPMRIVDWIELGNNRILVHGTVTAAKDGTKVVDVLGTHLEVSSASIRHHQAMKIAEYIRDKVDNKLAFLMGDFNSQYTSHELEPLKSLTGWSECFRGRGWTHPEYTCWSGREIDFIWSGGSASLLDGIYVYHSTTSDHLALLVDIKLSTGKDGLLGGNKTFKWVFSGVMIVLVVLTAYLAAFLLLPESYWNRHTYNFLPEGTDDF